LLGEADGFGVDAAGVVGVEDEVTQILSAVPSSGTLYTLSQLDEQLEYDLHSEIQFF
jgi:hypothetical protein